MAVYFSNQLEVLLRHLRNNFFSSHTSFFEKRLLVVPNRKVGSWLRLRLAEELGVATGFETISLKEATRRLTALPLADEIELAFAILEQIPTIEALRPFWGKEKKEATLALHLSALFHRYLYYGDLSKIRGWQKELLEKVRRPETEKRVESTQAPFHLFGFSHLSPLHFSLFSKQGAFFYHLSACQEFWSDLLSEKSTLKHYPTLVEESSNQLLANLGKLPRSFAKAVEDSFLETVEDYSEPERGQALQREQKAMLYFEKREKGEKDDSLQIHFFSSLMSEVQGVFASVAPLLAEKKVRPRAIRVMAPDIGIYAPFIEAVFTNRLPFKIEDVPSDSYTRFFRLLSLEEKRWSVTAVFEVLRGEKKWSEEELETFQKWVEKSGIRWGYDREHIEKISQKRVPNSTFVDGRSTWCEGLNTLFRKVATTQEIAFSDIELLGSLAAFIHALYRSLKPFHESEEKTVKQWCELILDTFSLNVHWVIEKAPTSQLYSFGALLPFLEKELAKEGKTLHGQEVEAITFSSLQAPLPSAVTVLMGMNHDTFPRKERWRSLDLLRSAPSKADEDRARFLEALLVTRQTLIITYQGRLAFDQSLLPPSSLVSELISEGFYEPIEHPDFSREFAQEPTLSPVIEWTKNTPQEPAAETICEIRSLLQAVRNPLKPYFEKKLQIRFEKQRELEEEEEFSLSPLRRSILRKEALKQPLDRILKRASQEGAFPLATFNKAAQLQIEEEINALKLPPTQTVEVNVLVGNVRLVGAVEGVAQDVFYTPDSFSFEKVVKNLPLFLLSGASRWVFAKDQKVKERFFENPEVLLKKILDFSLYCEQFPCPLFPEIIKALLEEKGVSFESVYSQEWASLNRYKAVSFEPEMWREMASSLYAEVKHAWF